MIDEIKIELLNNLIYQENIECNSELIALQFKIKYDFFLEQNHKFGDF
jgi:hypothetical protein